MDLSSGSQKKHDMVSAQNILNGLNKAIQLVDDEPSVAGIFASIYNGKKNFDNVFILIIFINFILCLFYIFT